MSAAEIEEVVSRRDALRTPLLFLNVFVIATCGLIYELLAGTVASYVLGDSVTQFSLVIGLYLSALGVGAWLSGFIQRELARKFVDVELAVALLGGFSAPLLFIAFSHVNAFRLILYALVFAIGTLVGLELPLLMRILREKLDFSALVSRVLSVDYIGSLVAAVLFPMLLVPKLGLIRTSLLFGLCNAAVGIYGTHLMRPLIGGSVRGLRLRGIVITALLVVAMFQARRLTALGEEQLYADPIVFSRSTPYQRIVITESRAGFQLFLNSNLQFSSADEYRYHEALVHPAMAAAPRRARVLILGGGDGLALREVLRYPDVQQVTLVDLDHEMTRLSESFPPLGRLNQHSFRDRRVRVINADAMTWLQSNAGEWDVAIVDFPDPNNFALGKLFTTRFYRILASRLTHDAVVSVQSTSPLNARRAYWCVVATMEAAGFDARGFHTTVPAFGVWGFVLASPSRLTIPSEVRPGLRFLNRETLASLFVFPADMTRIPVEINRLDNQALVRYYEEDWKRWQ